MAEIILPPEENEKTPLIPELDIDKPTENSKVISIEFEAKKTNKVSTKDTNQQLYTTDTDAWFEFKETSLEGANGTYSVVFRNRHDGSIFQRTGDVVNGVAYYKIPHQEIRHAGAWRGQIVYTLSNGDTTSREFDYDVKGHILDGKDVREIVVEDFETLMSQLRGMKDNAEVELANYQELLDTGVLQTNINEKLEQLEEEYAPKLTEVTAQLAKTGTQLQETEARVSEHIDEVFSFHKSITWDAEQTGEQIITGFPFIPKVLMIDAVVPNTKKVSYGKFAEGGQHCIYQREDTGAMLLTNSNPVFIADQSTRGTRGYLTVNSDKTITLDWDHLGAGATGEIFLRITALSHGGEEKKVVHKLKSPYENVDWNTFEKLQGNTHNHGFEQWHVDNMYDNGSRFIGLHPHYGKPLYPASEHDMVIPEDAIEYALAEHYGNESNPHPSHFSAIGSTLTTDEGTPHSGFEGDYKQFLGAVRDTLQVEDGGGVMWNHPGPLVPVPGNPAFEGMKKMYDYAPDLFLGVEFYNDSQGKTYEGKDPWMKGYWDELLKTGRQVWGFMNPDYEARRLDPYPDWEGKLILLIPEKTREACLRAIRNGQFFCVLKNTGFYFNEIKSDGNIVSIDLNDVADEIRFITADRTEVVSGNNKASIEITQKDVYVRIEAQKGDEQIFSQAIMFQ